MATFSKFEELESWQSARTLAHQIFLAVKGSEAFSRDFRTKDQILASSGSIMDNIAEGFERNGRKEFVQFLSIAKGSCGEVRSQLYRSLDRAYLPQQLAEGLVRDADELSRKIGGFINYLNNSEYKGTKFR